MSDKRNFTIRWRWEMATRSGLPSVSRAVLHALGIHMDDDGRAFPSIDTLATESGYSEKCVRTHLTKAAKAGWISRTKRRGKGKDWAQYYYQALIPVATAAPEPYSAASDAAPEPDAVGTAFDALGAEPNDCLHRNDVPTNSTSNSTRNTTKNTTRPPVNAMAKNRSATAQAALDTMLAILKRKTPESV